MGERAKNALMQFAFGVSTDAHPSLIDYLSFKDMKNCDLSRRSIKRRLGKRRIIDEAVPYPPSGVGAGLYEFLDPVQGHLVGLGVNNGPSTNSGPSEWLVHEDDDLDEPPTDRTPKVPEPESWDGSAPKPNGGHDRSGASTMAADPTNGTVGWTGPAGAGLGWTDRRVGLVYDTDGPTDFNGLTTRLRISLTVRAAVTWTDAVEATGPYYLALGYGRQPMFADATPDDTEWDRTEEATVAGRHDALQTGIIILGTVGRAAVLAAPVDSIGALVIEADLTKVDRNRHINRFGDSGYFLFITRSTTNGDMTIGDAHIGMALTIPIYVAGSGSVPDPRAQILVQAMR